jgi:CRISPR/Cas system-associated protein Cas7 (RAMP superfamily)
MARQLNCSPAPVISKDEGQMLMKMTARSGAYAQAIRYKATGIGVDTDKWCLFVTDSAQRQQRHHALLAALRDMVLSPSGALTTKMLPHLTGLVGAMTIRPSVGRAPIYSALAADFLEQLAGTAQLKPVEPFHPQWVSPVGA